MCDDVTRDGAHFFAKSEAAVLLYCCVGWIMGLGLSKTNPILAQDMGLSTNSIPFAFLYPSGNTVSGRGFEVGSEHIFLPGLVWGSH